MTQNHKVSSLNCFHVISCTTFKREPFDLLTGEITTLGIRHITVHNTHPCTRILDQPHTVLCMWTWEFPVPNVRKHINQYTSMGIAYVCVYLRVRMCLCGAAQRSVRTSACLSKGCRFNARSRHFGLVVSLSKKLYPHCSSLPSC